MAANLKGQTEFVDLMLESWARWGRAGLAGLGWPTITMLGRVMDQGFTGAAQKGCCIMEVNEACELTERAVLRLTPNERKIVTIHYLNWQPMEVSAKRSGLTVDSFKTRLYRARRRIADYLDGAMKTRICV